MINSLESITKEQCTPKIIKQMYNEARTNGNQAQIGHSLDMVGLIRGLV